MMPNYIGSNNYKRCEFLINQKLGYIPQVKYQLIRCQPATISNRNCCVTRPQPRSTVNIQPQSPHPIASSPMAPHNMVLLVTMNDDHDSQPRNSANITHIKHQSRHLCCMKKTALQVIPKCGQLISDLTIGARLPAIN